MAVMKDDLSADYWAALLVLHWVGSRACWTVDCWADPRVVPLAGLTELVKAYLPVAY